MKFTLKNKVTQEVLCIGTKQECMHFIKCRKLNRDEVYFETNNEEPAYHTTVPITEDDPPKKIPFFKRMFS